MLDSAICAQAGKLQYVSAVLYIPYLGLHWQTHQLAHELGSTQHLSCLRTIDHQDGSKAVYADRLVAVYS